MPTGRNLLYDAKWNVFILVEKSIISQSLHFPFFSKSPSNGVTATGFGERETTNSKNTLTGGRHSFQSKSKIEIIMQSKVAFVLVCILVMWLGIGMGKFIMWSKVTLLLNFCPLNPPPTRYTNVPNIHHVKHLFWFPKFLFKLVINMNLTKLNIVSFFARFLLRCKICSYLIFSFLVNVCFN